MANILPTELRKRNARLERARLTIAGSMVAIVAAALSMLAFVPASIAIREGMDTIQNSAVASSTNPTTAQTASLTSAQNVLTQITPLLTATTSPTDAITAALSLRPAGISVTGITYAPGSLMLVGTAQAESDIDSYRTALAHDPHFTTVSVPVSVLFGENGGSFSVKLSGAF